MKGFLTSCSSLVLWETPAGRIKNYCQLSDAESISLTVTVAVALIRIINAFFLRTATVKTHVSCTRFVGKKSFCFKVNMYRKEDSGCIQVVLMWHFQQQKKKLQYKQWLNISLMRKQQHELGALFQNEKKRIPSFSINWLSSPTNSSTWRIISSWVLYRWT